MDSYFCLYKMLIFFCKMQTSRGEKHLKNKIDRRKKMRKKSTKLLALLTAGITAASLLAGCGSGGSDNAGTTDQAQESETKTEDTASTDGGASGDAAADTTEDTAADTTAEAVSYPLAEGGELTYWLQLNPNVSANYTNLGDTELGKNWQANTGVTIEFQHPAAGQENEQFNLMVADGNLPDIIERGWVNAYPGGPEKAISDGVIIALNDVIDQYCPNLKKYLSENPDIDRMVKTDNGTYFAFPFIRGEDGLCYTVGSFIRKDWLDELGLEVPTTIDEWHDALLAFKEQKGAAAPLCYDNANFKFSNPFAFAYGVGWSSSKFILDDNGEVVYAPAQDGWKEYLTTMHQWYEEGLIDADFATLNGDQVTAKMTTDQAGASVGWAASRMQLFMTTAQQENPDYLLVPAPQPVLEKGATPQYGYKENNFPDVGAAITGSCKNVELAAKFLDYGYSEEGHNLFNFGTEGVSYNWEGDTAVYTETITNNEDGWPIAQALAKYIRANYNGPFVQDLNYLEQYLQLETAKLCPSTWGVATAADHTLPPVTPTEEESKELATITNELDTYMEEMMLKFIFGTESLDNWDSYIQTLEGMNLGRAIEIEKAALERYNAR